MLRKTRRKIYYWFQDNYPDLMFTPIYTIDIEGRDQYDNVVIEHCVTRDFTRFGEIIHKLFYPKFRTIKSIKVQKYDR